MASSPAKRVVGTLLFLAALVAIVGFYFLVFAESQQIEAVPGVGQLNIVAISVAVLLALVAVILIILLAGRRQRHAEFIEDDGYFVPPEPAPSQPYRRPAFEEVDDELVVYDIWRLPVARKAWGSEDRGQSTFYFPLHVEGGVYVNDYIPVGTTESGPRIKLRTLLAGPPDVESAAFTIPGAGRAAPRGETRAEPRAALAERMPAARRPERPERADEPRRPERPTRDLPGDSFMRDLQRRFGEDEKGAAGATQVAVTQEAAYYDYGGDIHDVIDVEGIGPVYAERLRQIGIRSTARLCYEGAASIAARIDVPATTVESWQAMSQLMKVSGIGPQYAEALARSGIDMDGLRRRSPARIADEVNAHLETLGVTVVGQRITEKRVATWQHAAKSMRRVRMQVPEA